MRSSAAIVVGPALAGSYANSGRLSHTDSQAAYDSLAHDFPQQHGDEARIVFADIQRDRPAIDAYLHQVANTEGVISVESSGGVDGWERRDRPDHDRQRRL